MASRTTTIVIVNAAAAGVDPIPLMAMAGHRSRATTQRYLHLAGVVFRDEAQALADRYKVVLTSDDFSESESIETTQPSR